MDRLQSLYEMLAATPDDPFLSYAIALEIHRTGDTPKAIELLNQLLLSHPDYLGTYYQLGKYYEEMGRFTDAVTVYRSGLELARHQGNHKTYNELKEALFLIEDDD